MKRRTSLTLLYAFLACSIGALVGSVPEATAQSTPPQYGLEWPGTSEVRRMLYWHNPFPIYDATYIFKVYPRKKTGQYNQYTTFFWGNDGTFTWDNTNANTYYGAHPYPVPNLAGAGQWEISVWSNDFTTGTEVDWDRWHTQAFRAWRESPSITHHEFYWDLPDTSKVITYTVDDSNWASRNPPTPAIVMGQAPDVNGGSWGGYPGWEEFYGIIRGIQIYHGLLSLADVQAEIAAPLSTAAGQNLIWYLNVNPRPGDVTDKKGIGVAHNPSWSGTTALEWTDQDTDGDSINDASDNCIAVANSTQLDADNDGYGNICDADLNNSGTVTTSDFALLRSVLNRPSTFSPLAAAADLNGSGTVTTGDFTILLNRLNTAPGPSGLHPNCPPTCP